MTARASFTETDVRRAVKGVAAAGFVPRSVVIEPSGQITVAVEEDKTAGPNPCDALLDAS